MSVRVLPDTRDHVLLDFNRVLVAQTLKISIRSLDVPGGGFVWPDGVWRSGPYFFTIHRVAGSVASTSYRMDAQILDHLGATVRFEVESADGVLRARVGRDWRRRFSGGPEESESEQVPATQPDRPPPTQPEPRPWSREPDRIAAKLVIATVVSVVVMCAVVLAMGRCVVFGVDCRPLMAEPGPAACDARKSALPGCALPPSSPGALAGGEGRTNAAAPSPPLATARTDGQAHPGEMELPASGPGGPAPDDAASDAHAFDEALICARRTPCAAPACFHAFGEMAAADSRRADMTVELARARAACARTGAGAFDGTYAAWLEPGCGQRGQGFSIEIRGTAISWRLGVTPQSEVVWSGWVDEAGRIRATAQTPVALVAVGDVQVREIRLRALECGPGEARVARLFARQGD